MWIVYVIVGVVVLVILAMMIASHHPSFKMTSYTRGTVVAVEEREIKQQVGRRLETELICRYTAGGAERQIVHVLQGKQAKRFPVGAGVPVRYYPANPDLARVAVR